MPDEKDVDKLRAAYKKLQDDIATLQQQATATQAELKATEAQVAEISKATAGYDKSGADMQLALDGDQAAIDKKRPTAEFKVKDLKDPLDQKIAEFDAALADQAKDVGGAADAASAANAASDKAAEDLREKQSSFAATKDEPRALGAKLHELKALLAEVAKAETQDDAVAMYFYVTEAAAMAKDISIPKADDYTQALLDAQSAVEDAKTAAAGKKSDSDTAATAAADAKKKYDAARASRRADLLKALRDVKPPPPQP